MNPIEFGKFIATLRNEKNLTQEELAEKLYIDKRKVSRWECGTSIPEFDMLIKLSEILDISLFELSICKRIENESITRKIINKFKNIKDFRKYKAKKKIGIIMSIILFIILVITTIYTIKYNNTVNIYELQSLDDKYSIEGNYIRTNDYSMFNITSIGIAHNSKKENETIFKNCEYEILDNNIRVFYIINNDEKYMNTYKTQYHDSMKQNVNLSTTVNLNIKCTTNNKKTNTYSFDIKLLKKYDNKLF